MFKTKNSRYTKLCENLPLQIAGWQASTSLPNCFSGLFLSVLKQVLKHPLWQERKTWKKRTQRSNQYKLNNRKLRKNGLPGREIASSKLAQVSTATNSPPKLFRCILAANWRFEFGVTGYKFWNWYNLWNAISLLTAGNVQKTIQSTASLRTNGHEFLISWTLQLWDLRKNAEFLVLFLFLCGI